MRLRGATLPFCLALSALLLLAGTSFAQSQTGALRGKATDSDGSGLPGVQVRLLSDALLGERVAYTEENGAFSFAALPPGSYTLEATLAGFAKYVHEGVRVGLNQTKNIPIQMQLESVSAQINVVAEEPLLDPSSHDTGARVSSEELISVPTARDPWAVLSLVPGLQTDRINVGASESGQQSNFAAKGDNGDNAIWTVDGVNITDQSAAGSSPTYYDFGAIEEIQVTSGGADVTHMTAGLGVNIVTKKGSNSIKGSARSFFSNDSLQGDNISSELEADGFKSKRVDSLLEFGGEVGFPVVQDRLWVWGSGNRNKIDNITITDVTDKTELVNFAAKVNGQVTSNNEATLFYHFGDKKKQGRDASVTRTQPTTWNQKGPSPIYKVEDQQIFGSNTVLTGKYAYVSGGFELKPQGGGTVDGQDVTAFRDENKVWQGTYLDHETTRPQSSIHLDGSHFTTTGNLDHEFKAGFEFRTASVDSTTFWPGSQIFLDDLVPGEEGVVAFSRSNQNNATMDRLSAYLQDTINFGNMTINVGVRLDTQAGAHDGGIQEANPLFPDILPAVEFGKGETEFRWTNLAPRLGITYELGQDTLVKASYAMYADNLPLNVAGAGNPAYIYSSLYAIAVDSNGDQTIQLDEIVSDLYGPTPADPVNLAGVDQIDSDLSAPLTNEVILGASHQLTNDFVVGGNVTYRRRTNPYWDVPLISDAAGNVRPVQRSDFVLENGQNLTGSFTQDGTTVSYSEPNYVLASGLTDTGGVLTTNRDDFHENFFGIELTWNKRFSNNWLLGGNFAWNDWTEHFDVNGVGAPYDPTRYIKTGGDRTPTNFLNQDGSGPVTAQSTSSGAFGDVFVNANWQSNLRGAYRTNFGLEVGSNVSFRQGYPIPVVDGSASDPFDSDARELLLVDADEFRHDNIFLVDLRLAYAPQLGPVNLELGLDIFNVLNNDVLLQQRREAELSTFGSPVEILGPRMFRLGARVTF